MNIILLEKIAKLGIMGQVVSVKRGYALNYLFPRKKALRATKENIDYFVAQKAVFEENISKQRETAHHFSQQLENKSVILIRQASEAGHLYGSVSSRDIVDALKIQGINLNKQQVVLDHPIKNLGMHSVYLHLHSEVNVPLVVNVALTEEEALKQQAKLDKQKKSLE